MLTFPENSHKSSQFTNRITWNSFKSHMSYRTPTSFCSEPTGVIHTLGSGHSHRYWTCGGEIPAHSRLTHTSWIPFQDCQQRVIII